MQYMQPCSAYSKPISLFLRVWTVGASSALHLSAGVWSMECSSHVQHMSAAKWSMEWSG